MSKMPKSKYARMGRLSMQRRLWRVSSMVRPYLEYEDHATAVIDILADLQHYAKARDIDFAKLLRIAKMHYEAESAGEL